MKRYLLFAGYYERNEGGWLSFIKDFAGIMEVLAHLNNKDNDCCRADWAHVVDLETGRCESLYPADD